MTFLARGLNSSKTAFHSRERAKQLAADLRGKVTYALVQQTPRYGEDKRPPAYAIELWNWQTQRRARVYFQEDLEDALEYVGPLDPSEPSAPPPDRYSRWCC